MKEIRHLKTIQDKTKQNEHKTASPAKRPKCRYDIAMQYLLSTKIVYCVDSDIFKCSYMCTIAVWSFQYQRYEQLLNTTAGMMLFVNSCRGHYGYYKQCCTTCAVCQFLHFVMNSLQY